MKILVIPSWYPTPERPLWCTWILPHISALRDAGHDVYVLQVEVDVTRDPEKMLVYESVQRNSRHLYAYLPIKYHKFYRTRFYYGDILQSYSDKLHELYIKIKEEWGKPDVIHAHVSLPAGYGAAYLGQLEQIPVVVTEHYSGFENDARFFWRVGCFVKEMADKVQGFYSVSPGFSKRIDATGLLKVTGTLPNPIDTDLFSLDVEKQKNGVFRVVMAGSRGKVKGADVLFAAMYQLLGKLNWSLTILGDFEQKSIFKSWFDNPMFSERVNFLGKVPQKDLVRIYSNSDLYVVSSRSETANVSMLEAMACGIPVVTSRCGAPETLVDDTVSMSIPNEDSSAMANAILAMSENIEKYKREELHEFVVRNYSKAVVADSMIAAYTSAIHNLNKQ
jgi:glycosyltransferase involved in cell wall biosynthesis